MRNRLNTNLEGCECGPLVGLVGPALGEHGVEPGAAAGWVRQPLASLYLANHLKRDSHD